MIDPHNFIVGALVLLVGMAAYIIYLLHRRSEGWEVVVPRSSIGQRELPPNFTVNLANVGNDNYRVSFSSAAKDKLIDTIFLHRPEDEPMLHYVLRSNMSGVALDTLPASTLAELWFVENMGMCWSSVAPIKLPEPGQSQDVEMTVAFCI